MIPAWVSKAFARLQRRTLVSPITHPVCYNIIQGGQYLTIHKHMLIKSVVFKFIV